MRYRFGVIAGAVLWVMAASVAGASECPGNPDALGVSRVLVVDPTVHARLGSMQYHETLPLAAKEVVLTFDDGPIPPYTTRVLAALAAECVKATFFIVGGMARLHPDTLRQIAAAGHTIGTHSQNHPMTFASMPLSRAEREIESGIKSVTDVLGENTKVAPFFRIPGLARTNAVEAYLASQGLMLWSADFPADDWRHISANEVIRRAMQRLRAKGRGILLLHDMQPATAAALPRLLRELKAGGYRIVQVVPATPQLPPTFTVASQWRLNQRTTIADQDRAFVIPASLLAGTQPAAAEAVRTNLEFALPNPANAPVVIHETQRTTSGWVQRETTRKSSPVRPKPVRLTGGPAAVGPWPASVPVRKPGIR